jgi:acetyltransferase-like isoleucine patch superfamily enzyme
MQDITLQRINSFAEANMSAPFDPSLYELVYEGSEPAELEEFNIHVENPGRKTNRVFVRTEDRKGPCDIRIRFFAADSEVYVDSSTQVRGLVRVHAPGCTTVIGGDNKQPSPFNITHWSKRSLVVIGRGTTSNGTQLVAMGEDVAILIAEDCMFSTGIWLKTSDMHAIVDLETNTMVNKGGNRGDILVGRHVWVGQDVLVTHGVSLGSGSIFGAKSLVRHNAPQATLWAGVPARQLRENVSWLRAHSITHDELNEVRTSLGLDGLEPAQDAPAAEQAQAQAQAKPE